MKYLKKYEGMSWDEYPKYAKRANTAYNKRIKITQNYIDNFMPDCKEITQSILDIFEEWKDEYLEMEIELAIPNNGGYPITVYYPLDDEHYPIFGGHEVDDKISSYLDKKRKIYYSIDIAYRDCLDSIKKIQNVRYLHEIDWKNENIKYLFDLTKKCADDIFNRLNKMYKIKVINSKCFVPEEPVEGGNSWKKCKPNLSDINNATKVSWLL